MATYFGVYIPTTGLIEGLASHCAGSIAAVNIKPTTAASSSGSGSGSPPGSGMSSQSVNPEDAVKYEDPDFPRK